MVPAFFSTCVTVFFGGIATSQSPFRAVAVCARMSLLIHSMLSPTLAEAAAGEITMFSNVIRIVAAFAKAAVQHAVKAIRTIRPGSMTSSLLQRRGDVLGMLLMALEDLQAGLQQALQFGIAGGGNQQGFERAVDRLVIGDFIGDIGLVVRGAL